MAVICFLTAIVMAVLLTITALVIWIASLSGSFIIATLSVAAVAVIVAFAIYLASLRRPIRQLADKIETVYDVAESVREAYEWVTTRLPLMLLFKELLFKEEKTGT